MWGIPELVENGKHAILVPPDESQALGRAIKQFECNPRLAEEYGIRAQKTVREKFGLDKMVRATQQVYASILEKHQSHL